jgi:signal transduction histidine kinase
MTVLAFLVAALVGVGAAALATWRSDDPVSNTRAGAARVGDDVALVLVAEDGGADAAVQARRDALQWMIVMLGASLVPAVGLGWFAAGRLLGTLDRAVAETEIAERQRQRQLQEVVHELRTPLAVVSANLELVVTQHELDVEAAGFVDASRRASERMRRTIDDLAGHGRLAVDAGAGPLDLDAEVAAIVAEHDGPARSCSVHLLVNGAAVDPDDNSTIARGPLTVPATDRAVVRTTLGNLLGNALRFAPAGSAITVSLGEHEGWAWVAVTDEGPGIPRRLQARVFERGWRGRHDRDRSGEPEGQRGLGLTIARQLTEAQGGSLTLDSEEGAGSTFTVWLPLDSEAVRADVVTGGGTRPRVRPWCRPDPVPA